MDGLDLYKFINEHDIENHWATNDETNKRDVVIFVNVWLLEDFCKVATSWAFEEDGVPCVLKNNYICIWMYDLCERFEIELVDIFGEDPEKS